MLSACFARVSSAYLYLLPLLYLLRAFFFVLFFWRACFCPSLLVSDVSLLMLLPLSRSRRHSSNRGCTAAEVAKKAGSLRCRNFGCNQFFDEENNRYIAMFDRN